jgi:hypothetical protein
MAKEYACVKLLPYFHRVTTILSISNNIKHG